MTLPQAVSLLAHPMCEHLLNAARCALSLRCLIGSTHPHTPNTQLLSTRACLSTVLPLATRFSRLLLLLTLHLHADSRCFMGGRIPHAVRVRYGSQVPDRHEAAGVLSCVSEGGRGCWEVWGTKRKGSRGAFALGLVRG